MRDYKCRDCGNVEQKKHGFGSGDPQTAEHAIGLRPVGLVPAGTCRKLIDGTQCRGPMFRADADISRKQTA